MTLVILGLLAGTWGCGGTRDQAEPTVSQRQPRVETTDAGPADTELKFRRQFGLGGPGEVSDSKARERESWVLLDDASGLPPGGDVSVAGLSVGEVESVRLEGSKARVTMRIRDGVNIWSNAVVQKKAGSLLGVFYLEIDPGGAFSVDYDGNRAAQTSLPPGSEISQALVNSAVE